MGTCTPPNPVENVSFRRQDQVVDRGDSESTLSPFDIAPLVTGSNVHGGNPPRDLPVWQVHGSNPADAFKRLLGYSDMQTRSLRPETTAYRR